MADDTIELGGAFRHVAESLLLPLVQNVLNNHISVEGYSSVDVGAGHAMLTVVFVCSMVPCMAPWDIAYNKCYDIVRYGFKLIALVRRRITGSDLGLA